MPEAGGGCRWCPCRGIAVGMIGVWCALCLFLVTVSGVPAARLPVTEPEEERGDRKGAADYLSGEQTSLDELMFGVGESIELSCIVETPPMPVAWLKDGIAVKANNRTHTRQNLLKITNVSYDDSGIYSCALLRSGETLRNFTVKVADMPSSGDDEDDDEEVEERELPRWTQPEKMEKKLLAVPAASTVRFRCPATGKPPPTIYWLKNGKEFKLD